MKLKFYKYLKTQFNDLESAKVWYKKWKNAGQETEYGMHSLRSMAAHISRALEGKRYTKKMTEYIKEKYGTEIYFS